MKVLFFASLRERLGTAEQQIDGPDAPGDLAGLREHLAAGGPHWQAALDDPNLVCAVNQAVVHDNVALAPGDEVAFYPPVTGG